MAETIKYNEEGQTTSTIGGMEKLAEANPNTIIEGPKVGETAGGIPSTDINTQVMVQEPVTLPVPSSTSTLDSSYADDYVGQKTSELDELGGRLLGAASGTTETGGAIAEGEVGQYYGVETEAEEATRESAAYDTARLAAGHQTNFTDAGDGKYAVGGFYFNVVNPNTGQADPQLQSIVSQAQNGLISENQARLAVAEAVNRWDIQERTRPARERLEESQKQELASTKASEFRGGRTGTGNLGESVLAKVELEQLRQRQEQGQQINDLMMRGQNAIQQGYWGQVDAIQRQLEGKREEIRAGEASYLDRYQKLQEIKGSMMDNDAKSEQLGADRRVNFSKIITDYAKAGTPLSEDQAAALAANYGVETQDAMNIYDIAQSEYEISRTKEEQALAKGEQELAAGEQGLVMGDEEIIAKRKENMMSYLEVADKVGVSVPVTIGDATYTYQGYDESGHQTGTEYNKTTGEFFSWNVDNKTGEVVTTPISNIGAQWETVDLGTNGWWRKSPDGSQWLPATPGVYQTTNNQLFAEGEKPPPRPGGSPANAGQCGSYWCLKTGINDISNEFDSFDGKMEFLSGRYEEVAAEGVRTGMTFVESGGTSGHIGLVGDVFYDPNTKKPLGFFADESNRKPPGKETVSYSRPVYFDDPKIAGFFNTPKTNLPPTGTDSPLTTDAGAIISGEAPDKDTSTTDEKNYDRAKEEGYAGTFTDYLADKGKKFTTGSKADAKKTLETQAVEVIDGLLTHPGFSGAVGAKGLSSLFGIGGMKPIPGTDAASFVALIDRVRSLSALPALEHMRGLGAMSEIEFKTIKDAAAALSLDMKETDFRKELERLRTTLLDVTKISEGDDQESSGTVTITSPDGATQLEYDLSDPEQKAEYEQALENGYK